MVKNNNGYKFNVENIEKEVQVFCDKNQLSEQLSNELIYVCKSFCLFFNHCVSAKSKYDINQILDLFMSNLSMQAEAFGTGLSTSAGDMFVYIPSIAKKIQELKEMSIADELKDKEFRLAQKEKSLNDTMKRLNETEARLKEKEKELDSIINKSNNRKSYSGSNYDPCTGWSYRGHC